jgi:hypothetical protein
MKRILHLGCSWSQHRHENQVGVPENMVSLLNEKNIPVEYYSASTGGCDIGTQFEILKSEINNGYDYIIFQITSDQRHHIRIRNNKLDWVPSPTQSVYICDRSLKQNFVYWNPSYGTAIEQTWPIHSRDYRAAAKMSYAHDWDEQSSYFAHICAVKTLLEHSKIPYMIYTHYPCWWEKHNRSYTEYVNNIIDFDVRTELTEEVFDSFIVDNGHHLSSQGNRLVSEKLILPRVLTYL